MFNALPYYLRGQVTTFLMDDMLRASRAFGFLDGDGRCVPARPPPARPHARAHARNAVSPHMCTPPQRGLRLANARLPPRSFPRPCVSPCRYCFPALKT